MRKYKKCEKRIKEWTKTKDRNVNKRKMIEKKEDYKGGK